MGFANRLAGIALSLGCAGSGLWAQHLSSFGTPGLMDMPTAEVLGDGEIALTANGFGPTIRNTLTFQMLPWVYGSFRYAYIEGFDRGRSRYDRSFDIHFQLTDETSRRPAVALGLRDFGGTGIYAGEYLVATKTFAEDIKVTAGVGWGRLATRGAFESPLCWIANRFCTRPASGAGGIDTTGQVDFGNWFRGDIALFGGVKWDVNDQLSLLAEYSSDAYVPETSRGVYEQNIPFNFGLTYRFDNGTRLSGYYMYGTDLGVQITYVFDPTKPSVGAGFGTAPPSTLPVDRVALASWNLPKRRPDQPDARAVLAQRLASQGLQLEGFAMRGSTVTVRIENFRYGASAQAVGRANRILANTMPPEITQFEVILLRNGLPITRITTERSDFYELETDLDGAWRSLARARISDAHRSGIEILDDAYPRFGYRIGPYTAFSFFDPDDPLRFDLGVQLDADLVVAPGFVLSGQLRQPIIGNIDDATRQSDSELPRVRSDWVLYAQESNLELTHLTTEYFWRPRENVFARVTAGYLEPMFGGFSSEVLWYPVDSRLALGAEVNYARQRDFDMLFGFQDYDVITGHASVYYDVGNDYQVQVDAGRYLAGDWGATFSLDREFNNGFKVGGFFTLTDVPFEEFGEGSFDKGIRFEMPLSWFTGRPSRSTVKQVIRPVLRDGGARLIVRNRLYEYTREERANRLSGRWARYFR